MSLSLSGNILRVTLDLPVHRGKDAAVAYEDLHPAAARWGRYLVYVRRASSNDTEVRLRLEPRAPPADRQSWGEGAGGRRESCWCWCLPCPGGSWPEAPPPSVCPLQYERLETKRTFELPPLQWGERYCVSVQPLLPSRPNPASRTAEQCISIPPPTGEAGW